MSLSAQFTSEQLKEIIEDEKNTDKSTRDIPEQVEDGVDVPHPENTCSVLNTVLNTINKQFEHKCLDKAVRLLTTHPIRELPDDCVPGLPRTKHLVHQVWAIWLIVRRSAWDADMPGVLVGDEIDLGQTFTSVAVAMGCKLVTEKVVMGWPLSVLWGNTLEQWVILAHNDIPDIVSEEREWYPLQTLISVPCCLWESPSTPPHRHPALISALEPILVVTVSGETETFNSDIDEMTLATDFKLVKLLHAANANLTHEDLNNSIDELEYRWNIHLVSYDTSTPRVTPLSNGQLSYCSWTLGIFDEAHRYRTNNSIGWQIAMNVREGLKLQVTPTLGFHSLYDWCYQMMLLFSGAPENPEDNTVMEKNGAEALYSAVKSLVHANRTRDEEAQQDAVHLMIQLAQP